MFDHKQAYGLGSCTILRRCINSKGGPILSWRQVPRYKAQTFKSYAARARLNSVECHKAEYGALLAFAGQGMSHSDLSDWARSRLSDLHTGGQYLINLWSASDSVASDGLTSSVFVTTVSAAVLLQVLLILISGLGRKQLLQGLETVVASFLLVCLLILVLGLPIGIGCKQSVTSSHAHAVR